jgi:tetratricopeptide (TPR) repeat protein
MRMLSLQALDVGAHAWRWRLSDTGSGAVLVEQAVQIPADDWRWSAAPDLYRYVWRTTVPDGRADQEERLVSEVGAFIADEVLTAAVCRAITQRAPCSVEVVVGADDGHVSALPLELASIDGRPLAAHGDVALVHRVDSDVPVAKQQVGQSLRVLAIFSQPAAQSALALRRERRALEALVARLHAVEGRAVELAVAQYGVTREGLAELAADPQGFDVLHISGHGSAGLIMLEQPDGRPDPVGVQQLAALLAPLRARVKLAVVAACESAARSTAQTLRSLGLERHARALEADGLQDAGGGSVAGALARQLGCDTVAMRYPVADEFAIDFAQELYERLLLNGQPPAVAAAAATATAGQRSGAPMLWLGTPVLLGQAGSDAPLRAPAAGAAIPHPVKPVSGLPPAPERFVGRARAMAAASAALAPASGKAGVLLHGMAGAGKTTCALELAHRHADRFEAIVFWSAPQQTSEATGALAELLAVLALQLSPLNSPVPAAAGDAGKFAADLALLSEVLREHRTLMVLDAVETLLDREGGWLDARLGALVDALGAHGGRSRLVVTSRTVPQTLRDALPLLAVHALARDEALLLSRELDGLRALLGQPDLLAGPDMTGPGLLLEMLELAQGHPKVLELADAMASDPRRLADALTAARGALGGAHLSAFLASGTSELDEGQFARSLASWTTKAMEALAEQPRLLGEVIARLLPEDRDAQLLEAVMAPVGDRLGRSFPALEVAGALQALSDASLVAAEDDGQDGARVDMHAGVAETIAARTSPDVQQAVDTVLLEHWQQESRAIARSLSSPQGGSVRLVRTARAGASYALRQSRWQPASELLEQALSADYYAPATAIALLGPLRQIAQATRTPKDQALVANAMRHVDPDAAIEQLRAALRHAVKEDDMRRASSIAGQLMNVLRARGRLQEAMAVLEEKRRYGSAAGAGPWNLLTDDGRRLQLLGQMGEHETVLGQLPTLLARMAQLPGEQTAEDTVRPWNVRETILWIGVESARALERWDEALSLNAQVHAALRARRATENEVAHVTYNDLLPLIRLGRLQEAEEKASEVQATAERGKDMGMVARVMSARAELEAVRGHLLEAARMAGEATRVVYGTGSPTAIAVGHWQLAEYLRRSKAPAEQVIAHRGAAVLLVGLAGDVHLRRRYLADLAEDLQAGGERSLPATLEDLAAALGPLGGDFLALTERLGPHADAAKALGDVREAVGQGRRDAR